MKRAMMANQRVQLQYGRSAADEPSECLSLDEVAAVPEVSLSALHVLRRPAG